MMLRRRESTVTRVRSLTADERRVVREALEACKVATGAVCDRACDIAILFARAPSWWEVRGPRSLVAHAALATRADGIALGRQIFLRREHFANDGRVPIDLVAHEVTHVAQGLRDGWTTFYTRYGLAYMRGLSLGLDERRAYLAIPYEVEARAVAATADPTSRA